MGKLVAKTISVSILKSRKNPGVPRVSSVPSLLPFFHYVSEAHGAPSWGRLTPKTWRELKVKNVVFTSKTIETGIKAHQVQGDSAEAPGVLSSCRKAWH